MTGFFVPQKESTSWQSASSMPHSCAARNVPLPVTESRSSGLGVFMSRRVCCDVLHFVAPSIETANWQLFLVVKCQGNRSCQPWNILHKDACHHQDMVYRRQPCFSITGRQRACQRFLRLSELLLWFDKSREFCFSQICFSHYSVTTWMRYRIYSYTESHFTSATC